MRKLTDRNRFLHSLNAFVVAIFLLLPIPQAPAGNPAFTSLSTYLVDRLTDENPAGGGQGSGPSGDLRYAITNALSGDSIAVHVSGMITLSAPLPELSQDVTIQGPGANSLAVDGNGGKVFSVASGATVVISGMTITGGVGNGSGVFNAGMLTLNEVTISGNAAGDPFNGGGTGPGIWNYIDATLTMNNSTVSGNTAYGNLTYNPSRGGGIANYGTLMVSNSTISANTASNGFGGGISNIGTLTLTNSTISGNSAHQGGGIYTYGGTGKLAHVTLSDNAATSGGGIFNVDAPATLTELQNTLIANSSSGGNCKGKAVTSSKSSLSSDNTCALAGVGDQNDVDLLLSDLDDYGGHTKVHMPEIGSPAIDGVVGSDAPSSDQRGLLRPSGGGYDIGAVERQPEEPAPLPRWLYYIPVIF